MGKPLTQPSTSSFRKHRGKNGKRIRHLFYVYNVAISTNLSGLVDEITLYAYYLRLPEDKLPKGLLAKLRKAKREEFKTIVESLNLLSELKVLTLSIVPSHPLTPSSLLIPGFYTLRDIRRRAKEMFPNTSLSITHTEGLPLIQ